MNVNAGLFGILGDSWKEEVLLHDGQRIIVERSQTYGGRSEPGQSGPVKEHTIRFKLPGENQVYTWVSEYGEELGRTNFNLLAVHVLNGTPYLVASPNLCLSYNKWGRPNPPYVFFKYESNGWRRISLNDFPAEFKTLNVATNVLGRDVETLVSLGLVSAERIKEMNRSSAPQFKSILREPLPNAGLGCVKTDYYGKAGWLSPDWFIDQVSLEACLEFCDRKKIRGEICPCNAIYLEK